MVIPGTPRNGSQYSVGVACQRQIVADTAGRIPESTIANDRGMRPMSASSIASIYEPILHAAPQRHVSLGKTARVAQR